MVDDLGAEALHDLRECVVDRQVVLLEEVTRQTRVRTAVLSSVREVLGALRELLLVAEQVHDNETLSLAHVVADDHRALAVARAELDQTRGWSGLLTLQDGRKASAVEVAEPTLDGVVPEDGRRRNHGVTLVHGASVRGPGAAAPCCPSVDERRYRFLTTRLCLRAARGD